MGLLLIFIDIIDILQWIYTQAPHNILVNDSIYNSSHIRLQ